MGELGGRQENGGRRMERGGMLTQRHWGTKDVNGDRETGRKIGGRKMGTTNFTNEHEWVFGGGRQENGDKRMGWLGLGE